MVRGPSGAAAGARAARRAAGARRQRRGRVAETGPVSGTHRAGVVRRAVLVVRARRTRLRPRRAARRRSGERKIAVGADLAWRAAVLQERLGHRRRHARALAAACRPK